MTKVNVVVDYKLWLNKIKSPKKYLDKKLKNISNNIIFFKKKKIIFTVFLTNSLYMKKLNKKFRKINKPTDVLSFPSFSNGKIKFSKEKKIYIGDIAISYEILNQRSKKSNFLVEFDKVWIHGFLHLLGYNHIKNKDYFKMNKLEKKVLNIIYS